MVFQRVKLLVSTLKLLLKLRSFKWMLAFGGIHKDLEILWGVNPIGAFLLNSKRANDIGPVWWIVQFIGFTDGAWKKQQHGAILSGIGGIFLNSKQEVIFSFSGNSDAKNPLEAEFKAVLFMYKQITDSPLSKSSLQLYTDSMILYNAFLQARDGCSGNSEVVSGTKWEDLIINSSIKLSQRRAEGC